MSTSSDWINFGVGMVYIRKGRYEAAENKFNELLANNPSYGYAYTQLGYIRKNQGKKEESIAFFNKAMKHLPDEEMGIYQSGLIHGEYGNYDDASDHYSKVLKLNPFHIDAILNLGFAHGRKGDFEQAEKLIEDAYRKDTAKKDGFARLGWIKTEAKDWFGADEIMNRDYEENRLSPAWQVNLAQVFGRVGKWGHAIELIEQTYKVNQDLKDGYARLGWIKTETQDWKGALGLMVKDYGKNRLSQGWQKNLAMILVFNGEYDNAIKLVKDLYSNDKDAKDGHAIVGWACYLSSGDELKLRDLIEKDASLNRLAVFGNKLRAYAMSIHEELSPACALIESLYAENYNLKDGYAVIGWSQIQYGMEKEGLALMNKDYRLKRLSIAWLINYAYCLACVGQSKEAQSLFNEVMKIEPDRIEFRIGFQLCPLETMTKYQFKEMIGFSA